MSTATPAAIEYGDGNWALHQAASGNRTLARRMCQAVVLLPLFALVLLPEYVQGLGDPETKSVVYRATWGPLRMIDGLLLGLVAVHGAAWASSRRLRVQVPRSLAVPGLGFLAAIAVAMIFGWLHRGVNLFFDWRALALGIGLYIIFAMWVQTPEDAHAATVLFAGYMAVRIADLFVEYARGAGDMLVGIRIPVFDGPTLSAMVFTAVLALQMSDATDARRQKLCWMGLSAAAYLLVLLCFRRTFWAELGVATGLLLLVERRQRGLKLLLALGAFIAVAAMMGPSFYERMQSMDFTSDETEFSQGNPDHVGEVLDAWEQVERHPVLGLGLGRSFQTLRIQEWKEESVMVHNAPLHVWLKYGLLGLVCYAWFHLAAFRWLWRELRDHEPTGKMQLPQLRRQLQTASRGMTTKRDEARAVAAKPMVGAALVYLAALFVVSLGFTPWPFSSLQSTTLIAFVLAMAITGASSCRAQ